MIPDLIHYSFQSPMNKPFIQLFLFIFISINVKAQQAKEIKRFQLPEVKQGVAVDANHFYVINNTSITKHTKADGKQVAAWKDTTGLLKHINAGIVIGNKLYCSHSNYPDKPMASSIEVFDKTTIIHNSP